VRFDSGTQQKSRALRSGTAATSPRYSGWCSVALTTRSPLVRPKIWFLCKFFEISCTNRFADTPITSALYCKRQGGIIYPSIRGYNGGTLTFACHLQRSPQADEAWLYHHIRRTKGRHWTSNFGGTVETVWRRRNNRGLPLGARRVMIWFSWRFLSVSITLVLVNSNYNSHLDEELSVSSVLLHAERDVARLAERALIDAISDAMRISLRVSERKIQNLFFIRVSLGNV
jgi:preprotein translocase subunit SecG